jgi:hypothetical protein
VLDLRGLGTRGLKLGRANPDIEFVIFDPLADSPVRWKGLREMSDAMLDFLGAWESFRTEVEEYRELDGNASSRSCPPPRMAKGAESS